MKGKLRTGKTELRILKYLNKAGKIVKTSDIEKNVEGTSDLWAWNIRSTNKNLKRKGLVSMKKEKNQWNYKITPKGKKHLKDIRKKKPKKYNPKILGKTEKAILNDLSKGINPLRKTSGYYSKEKKWVENFPKGTSKVIAKRKTNLYAEFSRLEKKGYLKRNYDETLYGGQGYLQYNLTAKGKQFVKKNK